MSTLADTIAAVATPPGEGGIAVIRVSGSDAIAVVDRRFAGRISLATAASHTAHVGELHNASSIMLDQVVCTLFRAPHSYTGEDVVEVGCHGGTLVTRRVLEALMESGARHARPGEFTQRAFLNGRMDLSQAEAVADLIHAHSDLAHQTSVEQLRGNLLHTVEALRKRLLDSASMIELELDFAEEGYEFKDRSDFSRQVEESIARIDELSSTYRFGRVWREGVSVVIAGLPNVGKSSLLNSLLNADRAIVTDIPGTTRDFIEESLLVDGVQFRLTDTAGVRETPDPVESEGVLRSRRLIEQSDLVLFMLDQSRPLTVKEVNWVRKILDSRSRGEGTIFVLNKSDLGTAPGDDIKEFLNSVPNRLVVRTSARTGAGLDELKKTLVNSLTHTTLRPSESSPVVTNSRHHDALLRARSRLDLCLKSLDEARSGEFVAIDLRSALEALGEIIGVVTTEDILNNIFSRFCIGK
jgi:tRNA modification GTPase